MKSHDACRIPETAGATLTGQDVQARTLFKRYYAVFLFVLLEAGAISYYANSTSYTRATLLAGAARVTGGIEGFFASAGDYFSLRRENAVLLERLAEAETRLHAAIPADDTLAARTDGMKYLFGTAKVVSNSIARQDNFS